MREDRPLILLTNDDGVHSPGLAALCEAVAPLGEVLIAAPATQQTSTGRSYPRGPEWGKIQAISLPMPWGEIPAFSVTASPAACVGHGVLELAPRKPDLCISGINYGENLGKTLTYSGTFGAALQAADFGIPTLAVSRATSYEQIRGDYAHLDWSSAARAAAYWAQRVLREGLAPGVRILNINVPEGTVDPQFYRVTKPSSHDLFFYGKPGPRDFSQPMCLPGEKRTDFSQIEPESDMYAVCVDGVISVTPLTGNFESLDCRL